MKNMGLCIMFSIDRPRLKTSKDPDPIFHPIWLTLLSQWRSSGIVIQINLQYVGYSEHLKSPMFSGIPESSGFQMVEIRLIVEWSRF